MEASLSSRRNTDPMDRPRIDRCMKSADGLPVRPCLLRRGHEGACHSAPIGECLFCGAHAVRAGSRLECVTESGHPTRHLAWSPRSVIVGCRDMLREAAGQLRRLGVQSTAQACDLHADCAEAALVESRASDRAGEARSPLRKRRGRRPR